MIREIPAEQQTAIGLRRWLLLLVLLGMLGTAADLLLLEHYHDVGQLAPLALITIGLPIAGLAWAGGRYAVLILRIWMVLFVFTGAIGIVLHYNGNMEFQKEIDPSQQGWPLFVAIVRAKAPPALAPAAMIQLGLLGLAFTYRHPALSPSGGRT
jgi:hypothetical protein